MLKEIINDVLSNVRSLLVLHSNYLSIASLIHERNVYDLCHMYRQLYRFNDCCRLY